MKLNYIYHKSTKNYSFIQTAVHLKKLGIKNHMFMLKLYNPALANIDPHDPKLPPHYIPLIINECLHNPWYFLREVSRIPEQGNPKGMPFQLHRGNLAAIWGLLNGINTYLVIPRQTGKTQSMIALILWAFLFGMTNSETMFLNIDEAKSAENLDRLKIQRSLLPPYLALRYGINEVTGKEEEGIDNVRKITSPINKNAIIVKGKANSKEKANTIGRGSTQPIQYIDEFEFIDFIDVIMSASGPAFTSASRNARANKSLYGRIITSTPGDIDTKAGEAAARFLEGTCAWTEKFYDWDEATRLDYVENNSNNNTVYIQYSYQQLGKDEQWFNENCASIGDIVTIKRDILLQRIRGSSMSPFDQEDLERLNEVKGRVIEELTILKIFILKLYEKLDPSIPYFIGVDVSNGYNIDNSAVTVWNPYTQKTVGEFKSPVIGIPDLIRFLILLVSKVIPNGILIIERNANGESVIATIRESHVAHRLYYDDSKLHGDLDKTANPYEREAANRQAYGVWTGRDTRPRMFDLLANYVIEQKSKIIGENIINDIMNLVKTSTGKIAADKGFHDDCVMSYLMCLYVYYFGNNLYKYGFVKGRLPGEEELNKGLYAYTDAMSLLNQDEQDMFREYYKDLDDGEDVELNRLMDISAAMRTDSVRGGAISREDLEALAHADGVKPKAVKLDRISAELYREQRQAQLEAEAVARRLGATTQVNTYMAQDGNIHESGDTFFDDLFSDLY